VEPANGAFFPGIHGGFAAEGTRRFVRKKGQVYRARRRIGPEMLQLQQL
jgi:hypothetical protein